MEDDDIARRIRHIHDIEIAMDESGEDVRPLLDIICNTVRFMTREELEAEFLKLAKSYLQMQVDNRASKEQDRKEKESLELEISMLKSEKAQNEQEIEQLKAENKSLKESVAKKDEEITDARHESDTMKRDKFQSKSKRGIDGKKDTPKGRDDNKDDYDGTSGSATPQEDTHVADIDRVVRDKKDMEAQQRQTRGKYTLADAKESITYECDLSLLPEGSVVIGESEEIVFDEVRVVRALRYGMVTYRIKEACKDEDGNDVERWVEHTKHFRRIRNRAVGANGTGHEEEQVIEYENGHMPDQIPDTKLTYRMLAYLIYQHLEAHVPVNRLSCMFREFDFNIGRSTLGEWLEKGSALFEEAYSKLLDIILADNAVTYCDETWERLHLKDLTRKVYTWIIGNKRAGSVAYVYDDGSRGHQVLVDLLKGRKIKAMHTDGYTAYYYLMSLCIVQICCGAHVWRKIKEWYEVTNDPDARLLLLDLQWLFTQEAILKEEGAPPEKVLQKRNSGETTAVITRFGARLEMLKTKLDKLPKKGVTAVNYALNMQSRLFRWREDADYELDNNFAERAARTVALGRKTSLFCCSHHGAKSRAILRSFVETCKLQGKGIINYLSEYFKAVIGGRTDYENLLPSTIGVSL